MRYRESLFLLFFASFTVFAQSEDCVPVYKNFSDSYFPIQTTDSIYYAVGSGRMVGWFEKEREPLGEHSYHVQVFKSVNGKKRKAYYREHKGAIYRYDRDAEIEEMIIPAHPKEGMKWTGVDKKRKYKVIGTAVTFKTSTCIYNDVLEVKVVTSVKKTIFLYYKKGIGLIGESRSSVLTDKKTQLFSFMIPRERKIIERYCIAPNCEGIDDIEVAKNCVGVAFGNYLKNLFVLNKNTVRGKYILRILVDFDGSIKAVKAIDYPEGGEKTARQLERIIKSYDRLKPGMVEGLIPAMCSAILPVNI